MKKMKLNMGKALRRKVAKTILEIATKEREPKAVKALYEHAFGPPPQSVDVPRRKRKE